MACRVHVPSAHSTTKHVQPVYATRMCGMCHMHVLRGCARCMCHVHVPHVYATCICPMHVPRVYATCMCHVHVSRTFMCQVLELYVYYMPNVSRNATRCWCRVALTLEVPPNIWIAETPDLVVNVYGHVSADVLKSMGVCRGPEGQNSLPSSVYNIKKRKQQNSWAFIDQS